VDNSNLKRSLQSWLIKARKYSPRVCGFQQAGGEESVCEEVFMQIKQ